MRLLTQNFFACLKCESFPLDVTATDIEVIPVEYDAEFTRRMLARIDYSFLVKAFNALSAKHKELSTSYPEPLPDTLEGADLTDDAKLLHQLHFVMNMVAVKNGELVCPECETHYPVNEFIPNFVLEG